MIKSALAFIYLTIVQSVHPPAPVEAKMGITPPVGDVPLDGNLYVLFVIAICIGSFAIYRKVKAARV